MALRTAHGRGKGALVRVETPPSDEQRRPARRPAASRRVERGADGRLTAAGARQLGRLGGIAAQHRRRLATLLADQLGLATVPESLAPYIEGARDYAETELRALADMFGFVGPGPSSMVQSAALALAASRAAYAAGDAQKGARLADQSRQARLTAHHLADLEAKARPTAEDPADDWMR